MSVSRQPRSRRRGSAKTLLSQQLIVDTTIDVMRREGLKKATMRRVAQELDTGPASLYVYIRNTAELHAMVIDALLGTIEIPQHGSWQRRLEQVITDYRDVLINDHGLARSALMIRPTGSNVLRLFDRTMALLIDGGVTPARAAWGADMLLLRATATAAEHAAPEDGDDGAGTDPDSVRDLMTSAVRNSDPHDTPTLAAHADAVLAGSPTQRWMWILRAEIAGIAAVEDEPST